MHVLKARRSNVPKQFALGDISLPDQINLVPDAPKKTIDALTKLINEILSDSPDIDSIEECRPLLFPNGLYTNKDPSTALVASMYSYCLGNPEAACYFAVLASTHVVTCAVARALFYQYHANMGNPESADEYQCLALKGVDACMKAYLLDASKHFRAGDFNRADHYVQRFNALAQPFEGKTPEIKFFKQLTDKNIDQLSLTSVLKNWEESQKNKFDNTDESEDSERWVVRWEDCPNKKRLCSIAVDLMSSMGTNTISYLEIGCHQGTLMNMIDQQCKKRCIPVDLMGIERDHLIYEQAKLKHPGFAFFSGDHLLLGTDNWLIDGGVANNAVDVMVLSQVCFFMDPNAVEYTLQFGQKKCRHIIILDDFSNSDGSRFVHRRWYLVHPFHTLLERYGFEVTHCEMLPKPNRGNNGILVARNRNKEVSAQ